VCDDNLDQIKDRISFDYNIHNKNFSSLRHFIQKFNIMLQLNKEIHKPIISCIFHSIKETKDKMLFCLTSKFIFIYLLNDIEELYSHYLKSDEFKLSIMNDLNYLSKMIDEFKFNNQLLNNYMYEYIGLLFENRSWISMNEKYVNILNLPCNPFFKQFLKDKNIKRKDLLLNITYVFVDSDTSKNYSYFKTIKN